MPRVITPLIIADFRKRLTDAAAELLAERGTEGFNMRELAKRLRVSPMTAYRYFKDKEEILGELRARGFARLADALEEAQAGAGPESEALQTYVRFATSDPATYRLMFDLFQPAERAAPETMLNQQRVREVMNRLAGADDDPQASNAAGQMLWSALHGALALHLAGKLDRTALDGVLAGAFALFTQRRDRPWRCRTDMPAALSAAE